MSIAPLFRAEWLIVDPTLPPGVIRVQDEDGSWHPMPLVEWAIEEPPALPSTGEGTPK